MLKESKHPGESRDENGTRGRVLGTARRLFFVKGYGGTSLSAIAKEVGISAPALYWHFESKEALLFAIIEGGMEDFLTILDDGKDEPPQRLAALVESYTVYQLERGDEVKAHASLMRQAQDGHLLSDDRLGVIRAQQRSVYQRFADTITLGIASHDFHAPDVTVTAFAIINMCENVSEWVRSGERFGAPLIAEIHVNLALRMVKSAPQEAST